MSGIKNNNEETAMQVLTSYLEHSNCRNTSERIAVLKAIYSLKSHFSVKELSEFLSKQNFVVSRGTIYNALKLFMRLNLVMCHKLKEGTRYEAFLGSNTCRRICTVCGKEIDIKIANLDHLIEETHFNRFRKERYMLYIYGVCSSCQAVLTRKTNKEEHKNKKNNTK